MATLILAEDDRALASAITESLSANHRVLPTPRLKDAFRLVDTKKPDLVIVDRVLLDGDGLELITYLRDTRFYTRTLVISKLHNNRDKISGLEQGADDYLAKPFSISELKLRVNNLLNKQKMIIQPLERFGAVSFYPEIGCIEYGNKRVQLRKKEADILQVLLRYRHRIVTHQMILDCVWPGETEIPSLITINVYLRRVRLKLGPHSRLIETVRGFGYTIRQ